MTDAGMTKEIFFYMLLEAVLFIIPLVIIIFKIGSWKREQEIRIKNLEIMAGKQDSQYTTILSTMSDIQCRIVKVETKLEDMKLSPKSKKNENT